MHILLWVIVIVLLIGLGRILKRKWMAQQEQASVSGASSADVPSEQRGIRAHLTSSIQERFQGWQSALGRQKAKHIVPQFRQWVDEASAADVEVQQWLAVLTDEQIGVLSEHLADFCLDMGFELSWLFEEQPMQNKELKQGLTQIGLLYCRASYEAVKMQEEVQIFRIYRDYMQNPQSRPHRELGEHLFGKLVEQGMSKVSISEHLAASDRIRQQQIVDAIEHSAAYDPRKLRTLLKGVLIERTLPNIYQEASAINVNGTAKA
ncbi:MAG: hypothetical protein R3A44_10795 [Caldilineaceae bacterium]